MDDRFERVTKAHSQNVDLSFIDSKLLEEKVGQYKNFLRDKNLDFENYEISDSNKLHMTNILLSYEQLKQNTVLFRAPRRLWQKIANKVFAQIHKVNQRLNARHDFFNEQVITLMESNYILKQRIEKLEQILEAEKQGGSV